MNSSIILGVCLAVVGAASYGLRLDSGGSPPAPVSATVTPGARQSAWQLAFIGLPGDRLLAAGLTSAQILSAASRLRESSTAIDLLDQTQTQLQEAESQLAALRRNSSSSSEPALLAQIATQAQITQTLREQVASQRTLLQNVVLQDATPSQRALVERSISGISFGLDPALALAGETLDRQRTIAALVKAEQRAIRIDEPLDPEDAAALAAARSNALVVEAANRLNTQWTALSQALNAVP
jgi:hypothetical protein